MAEKEGGEHAEETKQEEDLPKDTGEEASTKVQEAEAKGKNQEPPNTLQHQQQQQLQQLLLLLLLLLLLALLLLCCYAAAAVTFPHRSSRSCLEQLQKPFQRRCRHRHPLAHHQEEEAGVGRRAAATTTNVAVAVVAAAAAAVLPGLAAVGGQGLEVRQQ